jgi:hypothetical protein
VCPGCAIATVDTSCEYECGSLSQLSDPLTDEPAGYDITDTECSTCDDLPYGTPTQVQVKYNCLKSAYDAPAPGTADAAQFKRAVVARLKLLFEWRATDLSSVISKSTEGQSFNGLVATNNVTSGATAIVTAGSLTSSAGDVTVDAENTSTIDSRITSKTESANLSVGVVLAFNRVGWDSQNILYNIADAIVGRQSERTNGQ